MLGFRDDGLIVWDEEKDYQLFRISQDKVFSIKRVMTANTFIIKTKLDGVKVLDIDDLKSQHFSLKVILEAKENNWNYTESLQLQINAFDIVIAATQNDEVKGKNNNSVKVMKVKVDKM